MNVRFKAKFSQILSYSSDKGKILIVKFERNTMSDSSIESLAKLALSDKFGVDHRNYLLESITEV